MTRSRVVGIAVAAVLGAAAVTALALPNLSSGSRAPDSQQMQARMAGRSTPSGLSPTPWMGEGRGMMRDNGGMMGGWSR